MKIFLILFLFTLTTYSQSCKTLTKIRDIFQAGVNKEELNNMIELCKQTKCIEVKPYHAAATMKKAEFVWSPFEKLSNFKKGKKMLETFIIHHSENIEARYIRWLTQKMAPSFLNYNKNLEEDYNFIINKIHKSNIDFNYQKKILAHLKKVSNE